MQQYPLTKYRACSYQLILNIPLSLYPVTNVVRLNKSLETCTSQGVRARLRQVINNILCTIVHYDRTLYDT